MLKQNYKLKRSKKASKVYESKLPSLLNKGKAEEEKKEE